MIRRIGTDVDGFAIFGRLAAGERETVDDIALAEWQLYELVERGRFPVPRPRQVGVDADGWPIIGKY